MIEWHDLLWPVLRTIFLTNELWSKPTSVYSFIYQAYEIKTYEGILDGPLAPYLLDPFFFYTPILSSNLLQTT